MIIIIIIIIIMIWFTKKTGSTTLKEWTTPDSRNTPSTTNLVEEETVDAPRNDGNASMPEQVKRPNPWRKMIILLLLVTASEFSLGGNSPYTSTDKQIRTNVYKGNNTKTIRFVTHCSNAWFSTLLTFSVHQNERQLRADKWIRFWTRQKIR